MPEINEVLQEFLKEQFPSHLMEALELLANLNYPIPDKKSLRQQLEETLGDGEQGHDDERTAARAALLDRVMGTFEPVDFGLDTLQSALEKFAARRIRDFSSLIPWPSDWAEDLSIPDEPRIDIPVRCAFEDDVCGRAAEQLWREHVQDSWRKGFPPSQAECDDLRNAAERCRSRGLPTFGGPPCHHVGQLAYARCRMNRHSRRTCLEDAWRTVLVCRAALTRPYPDPFPGPFPGRGG